MLRGLEGPLSVDVLFLRDPLLRFLYLPFLVSAEVGAGVDQLGQGQPLVQRARPELVSRRLKE